MLFLPALPEKYRENGKPASSEGKTTNQYDRCKPGKIFPCKQADFKEK